MKLKYPLSVLLIFLLVSCGRKTVETERRPYEKDASGVISVKDSSKTVVGTRSVIVEEARKWLGTPYKYGGEDRNGVDCSGMVMKVYRKAVNVKLPRSSREQQQFCNKIKKSDIASGDLVFFSSKRGGGNVSHVGIYIGGDEFIHSSSSRGVIVSSLNEQYYLSHYHSSGRVVASKMRQEQSEVPRDTVKNDSTASARPGDREAEAIRDAVRRAMSE